MKQLEIEFFWPLTEQIPLDLDFKPCEEFYRKLSVNAYGTLSGSVLVSNGGTLGTTWTTLAPTTTSLHIQPSPNYAGHWEVSGENFQIYRETKPNWFHRVMNKLLINWEWKDKK